MSNVIDERVLSMKFDNKQFESNVSTTMSTLDKLKEKLKFKGSTKGLEEIQEAARNVDMNGLSSGVEAVRLKFSALEVMGVTALTRIANTAINTGERMVKALTIDPIKTGFQEYETQIGSIQTILANTQSKGSTLQDVNSALAELNTYADKTIYNFTQMTRNIGTFTAAGVDLDKAVSSIKGIANLAAVSGSTSQQASTAMYQLSQALAAGRVSLMDWNSVVNAGMGGELFQNALKRTATHMGKNVDAIMAKYGSFRESLTQGEWLTTEVLTETLTQLSGAYSEADLIAQGYTEKQAKEIAQLAETAVSAATEVKTFTQLWDTLKEAAQSGWTQSWQIMIGDFQEAKDLLTSISNTVSDMLNASAQSRNDLLTAGLSTGWKQLINKGISDEEGYRDTVKQVAKDHGVAIDDMIEKNGSFEKTLKEGWITGDILAESLDKMTSKVTAMSAEQLKANGYTSEQVEKLKELNKAVKDGTIDLDDFAKKMSMASGRENVIEGLKNVFTSLLDVIKPIKEAFVDIFPPMTGDQLYKITENFKELTEKLKVSDETAKDLKNTFRGLFAVLDILKEGLTWVVKVATSAVGTSGTILSAILKVTSAIGEFLVTVRDVIKKSGIFSGIGKIIIGTLDGISNAIGFLTGHVDTVGGVFESVFGTISKVIKWFGEGLGDLFSFISKNVSTEDLLNALASGSIIIAAEKLFEILDSISEYFSDFSLKKLFIGEGDNKDSKSIMSEVTDTLGELHNTLSTFTKGIKVGTLIAIAGAITMLTASVKTLSNIDTGDLTKSLIALGALLGMMTLTFNNIFSTLEMLAEKKYKGVGVMKSAAMLISLGIAVKSFAQALQTISDIRYDHLAKGIIAMAISLKMFTSAFKSINGAENQDSLKTAANILILAESTKTLADALSKFAKLSMKEIIKGLTAMGGALAELTLTTKSLNKIEGTKSLTGAASVVLLSQSLDEIAQALKDIGSMKWGEVVKGLTGLGGALIELAGISGILGETTKWNGLIGATSILIGAQSLTKIAQALMGIGTLTNSQVENGLKGIGGALTELAVVSGLLGKFGGFDGLIGAGTLVLSVQSLDEIAQALSSIGNLSWEEINNGLVGMGYALAEISIAAGLLGKLAGFSGILGGGSILIAVQSLDEIAQALADIGSLSWGEIAKGLVGIGAALTEIAGISGILGTITGLGGLVGAATLVVGVQSLEPIARSLQIVGSLTNEQTSIGLKGLGGALLEVAAISGTLGAIAGLAGVLGGASIWVAVQGLGTLAEALKKFGEMSWDEVKTGLVAMGVALAEVAWGSLANTLGIIGSMTIEKVAKPLGDLADSVRKWAGISISLTFGAQLVSLATGIAAFTFDGWAASAIATVAEPLGTLADSVKKWSSVTVPDGLPEQLNLLASGVMEFTFGGWGASALSKAAEPLGTMAESVNKWKDVTIPENMGDKLTDLADGVKAFSFAFMGGWSLDGITGPLGKLGEAVAKWKDVNIPEGMGEKLSDLADGINAFSFSFMGGWSLDGVTGPLGELAGSIKKWNGVSIPEGLGTKLGDLAVGLNKFTGLNSVDIEKVSSSLEKLSTTVSNLQIDTSGITEQINSLSTSLSNISISTDSFSNIGVQIVDSIVSGFTSMSSVISGTIGNVLSAASDSAFSSSFVFGTVGEEMMNNLISGINNHASTVEDTVITMVTNAASSLEGEYDSFHNAGYYLATGFANGIASGSFYATLKARAMAAAAAEAAKEELNEHSPSKVTYQIGRYFSEGFINAIDDRIGTAYKVGSSIAESAKEGLQKSINTIKDAINSGIDTQPVIRPVVDLSDISSGANSINSLLGMNPSIGVMTNLRAINSSMRTNQNGANDDVVNAINKMRKDLGNIGGDTYNVNGVSTSDADVVDAIKTIVRAVKVERRV